MSTSTDAVPIEEGLFTWPSDNPRLIASECPECGDVQFPKSNVCGNPHCNNRDLEQTQLSTTGTLYSYTIHHAELKQPYDFDSIPYAIGTVELPEGLNIVAKLTATEDELEIGMEMEFTVEELYEEEGTAYMTYLFEPTEDTQ